MNTSPRPRFPTDSLLVLLVQALVGAMGTASPYRFFRGRLGQILAHNGSHPADARRADIWAGDIYVLGLFGAAALAWWFSGANPVLNAFIAAFAVWRITEIVVFQLGVLLVDSNKPQNRLASLSRSVLSSMVNILAVVLLFAALEHIFASTGFVDSSRLPLGAYVPKTPGGWLYVSWTTLFTLGSTYSVTTGVAKALVMTEVASGLLLIVVSLASFVGAIQLREFAPPEEAPKARH